jgi:hypothetical protein
MNDCPLTKIGHAAIRILKEIPLFLIIFSLGLFHHAPLGHTSDNWHQMGNMKFKLGDRFDWGFTVWVQLNSKPSDISELGGKSYAVLTEYDCNKRQHRQAKLLVYSEKELKGRVVMVDDDPLPWVYPSPGGWDEHLIKITCIQKK